MRKSSFRTLKEYFSQFIKDLCTQTAIRLTLTSSGPSFRVHREVETLVPSAMIDTIITKQLYIGILFSQYILLYIAFVYGRKLTYTEAIDM